MLPPRKTADTTLTRERKMLNETELYRLLSACKEKTIDPSDRLKLEMWAGESEENRALLDLLTGNSQDAEQLRMLYSYDRDRVWRNVRREALRNRRRRIFRALVRTSAAAVLLLGLIWGGERIYDFYQHRDTLASLIPPGRTKAVLELSSGMKVALTDGPEQLLTEADRTEIHVDAESTTFQASEASPERNSRTRNKTSEPVRPLINRLTVPRGGEYQIELSDGTRVWLNAESEITFPTRFTDSLREVRLRGEAYFEVRADAAHPFIVHTDLLSVRVLGTSFNLTTYDDDPTVETTLISGSLKVIRDQVETLLRPGMQARLDKASNTMTTHEVYAESYAAWAHRMFSFFNEPIPSICRKLARWYDVEIDASDPALKDILYSGMIERAETLNDIAELFSVTNELIFREREGRIIVEKNRQVR